MSLRRVRKPAQNIKENVLDDKISWAEEMLSYGAQVMTNDNFEFFN
ncbi:hypothetical protein PQ459_13580 [Chryseobacterium sp. KACC 21268]|nr:hypothetical protein PQ459_13580 [Chryseobacterium sp. KACC 21268]